MKLESINQVFLLIFYYKYFINEFHRFKQSYFSAGMPGRAVEQERGQQFRPPVDITRAGKT